MGLMGAGGGSTRKIIDLIYPVGSVYISANDVNPQALFGGSWEQIQGRFLLASGNGYSLGATGGAEKVALTWENNGPHTHTRGSMNITGYFAGRPHQDSNTAAGAIVGASGAFSLGVHGDGASHNGTQQSGTMKNADGIWFNAANSWSGETSSSGSGTPHENMPPYLVVNAWKRTA
uniref:Baseplate protein n=1 Tax=Myoviridae sp. ctool15 TaxID=2826696 RepID=A0A8S5QXU9_9CAUD|nr:MAG TPA: baseplate protein [Myoviridae sp. ctool15]